MAVRLTQALWLEDQGRHGRNAPTPLRNHDDEVELQLYGKACEACPAKFSTMKDCRSMPKVWWISKGEVLVDGVFKYGTRIRSSWQYQQFGVGCCGSFERGGWFECERLHAIVFISVHHQDMTTQTRKHHNITTRYETSPKNSPTKSRDTTNSNKKRRHHSHSAKTLETHCGTSPKHHRSTPETSTPNYSMCSDQRWHTFLTPRVMTSIPVTWLSVNLSEKKLSRQEAPNNVQERHAWPLDLQISRHEL